jgi:outer membrane murein-binding lipoprotein Lpp
MKRFLMLVGVAAVAGAMYVAAAPGSRQASPPTARQFATLKRQVASLSTKLKALTKDEKAVKQAAIAAVEYIGGCFLDSTGNIQNLQVNEFGTTTTGFLFGTDGTAATPRSALDVDASGAPLAYLQKVTPACVTGVAAASQTSAHSGISRLQLWAERTR